MGRRTLWTGIIAGATIGGLVTLFNQETRNYVRDTAEKASDKTNYYINHPEVGVNKIKQGIVSASETISNNTEGAVNTLTQVEDSLQKFIK